MWFCLVELCGVIFSSQEATQEVALEKQQPSRSRNPSPSQCRSVYLGLNLSISLYKSVFILVSLSNSISFLTLSLSLSLSLSQTDPLPPNLHSQGFRCHTIMFFVLILREGEWPLNVFFLSFFLFFTNFSYFLLILKLLKNIYISKTASFQHP